MVLFLKVPTQRNSGAFGRGATYSRTFGSQIQKNTAFSVNSCFELVLDFMYLRGCVVVSYSPPMELSLPGVVYPKKKLNHDGLFVPSVNAQLKI
jgi:hypothetical protein